MDDKAYGKLVSLSRRAGGASSGICLPMREGRHEVTTAAFDDRLQIVGGDPWGTPTFTGLAIPTASTSSLGGFQFRYLCKLASMGFQRGEHVRLVGLRQYVELAASVPQGEGEPNAVITFPVTSPFWRFPDANISWHVHTDGHTWRDNRNPANADSLIFNDTRIGTAALLYQSLAPYVPPHAGRPWGKPLNSDVGTIHELRYPWRDSQVEVELDIPLAPACVITVYASVAQHDTSIGPPSGLSATQIAALGPEDRFWNAFPTAQYGRVAASLIFRKETGP